MRHRCGPYSRTGPFLAARHSAAGDCDFQAIAATRPLALHEVERGRVHAVAQAGGLGAVIEEVAQVRVTLDAPHLRALHADAAVGVDLDVLFGNGRPEAGPAGARVELSLRAEQGILAAHATENPLGVQLPVLAGEGALG